MPLESGDCEFHLAEDRRNGNFEFDDREQFCGEREPSAAKLFLLNGVEYTGAAENNMQPGGPSGCCWE